VRRPFLGIAVLLLASRGSVIRQEFLDNGTRDFDFMDPDCGSRVVAVPRDAVEVRYLGSGGVYIRWGGEEAARAARRKHVCVRDRSPRHE
jgi:hypothetical protein